VFTSGEEPSGGRIWESSLAVERLARAPAGGAPRTSSKACPAGLGGCRRVVELTIRAATAAVIRFFVFALNTAGAAWVLLDIYRWSRVPWPTGLWLSALLLGIVFSLIRGPRILNLASGVWVAIVWGVCVLMWRRETPSALLSILSLPLVASLILFGTRGAWLRSKEV
jgi:hypothetical protein